MWHFILTNILLLATVAVLLLLILSCVFEYDSNFTYTHAYIYIYIYTVYLYIASLDTTANYAIGPANHLLASLPLHFFYNRSKKIIQPGLLLYVVSTSSLPVVLGSLDWDCCYKSEATQIHQSAVLAPIPYIDRKFLLTNIYQRWIP